MARRTDQWHSRALPGFSRPADSDGEEEDEHRGTWRHLRRSAWPALLFHQVSAVATAKMTARQVAFWAPRSQCCISSFGMNLSLIFFHLLSIFIFFSFLFFNLF